MSQALHDRGFTGSRGFRVNSRGVALDDGPDGLSMGGGGGKTEVVVKGSSCKSAATRSLDDRSMLAIASIKARARTPQALWRAPTGAQARPITVCIIGCLCHPVAGGMTPRGLQTKTDERNADACGFSCGYVSHAMWLSFALVNHCKPCLECGSSTSRGREVPRYALFFFFFTDDGFQGFQPLEVRVPLTTIRIAL